MAREGEDEEEEEEDEPVEGKKQKAGKKEKIVIPPLVDPYKVVFKEYIRFTNNEAKDYYLNMNKQLMEPE